MERGVSLSRCSFMSLEWVVLTESCKRMHNPKPLRGSGRAGERISEEQRKGCVGRARLL